MSEPSSPTAAPSPLEGLHRRLGARFERVGAVEVVAGYGEPLAEQSALTTGAALVDRSQVGRLELTGEDRQRFLNGLVTCDVKGLAPGRAAYGFFTSVQGKILADAVILALEDRLWLELPPGLSQEIRQHLEKYIIADRVEVSPLEGMIPLALAGPGAQAALAPLAELPADEGSHLPSTLWGTTVRLLRFPLAGGPAFILWVEEAAALGLAEGLLGLEGVRAVGHQALDGVRVLRGVPAFGTDFGSDHFPQETGLEARAVSYTKGCYLGQEVVARIHYRGKANRAARRLHFASNEAPPQGRRLLLEGQEVGIVGSAVAPPEGGRAVGIAVVHHRGWEPGTRLEVEGGGTAEVAELPAAVG